MTNVETFSLNEKCNLFLNDIKWKNKISKSKFLRKVISYLHQHPEILNDILKKEE